LERGDLSSSELLGILAGAVTTLGFIPQVLRVFRLRSAREISLTFTILFLGGITLWLLYGISLTLLPVILWNALSLVLGSLLLYAKLKYSR
jgi:MtN3 and saliva related transmembrane protein